MGNGVGKLTVCFTGQVSNKQMLNTYHLSSDDNPLDDLGHSFCYIRPEISHLSSKLYNSESSDDHKTTAFRSISGASVSANASTPLSTTLLDLYSNTIDKASAFEGSTSFASLPLQPLPRNNSGHIFNSGPIERGFMSGPIERASGPLDKDQFQRSYSHDGYAFRRKSRKARFIRALRRVLSKGHNSIVAPIKGMKEVDWFVGSEKQNEMTVNFKG